MKNVKKQTCILKEFILVLAAAIMLVFMAAAVSADVRRSRNTTTVKSGCVVVDISGSFETPDVNSILSLINGYRKEACEAGNVPDPRDPSRMLTASDYVPLKWSTELEKMTMLRSAELAVVTDHSRPNGDTSPWNAKYNVRSYAENIAWGTPTMNILLSAQLYYTEKDTWISSKNSPGAGHYVSMINPNYTYIGVSSFTWSKGGGYSAMEFSIGSGYSESRYGTYGNTIQEVEVLQKYVSEKNLTPTAEKKTQTITASNITAAYSTSARTFNISASRKGSAKLTYSSNDSLIKVSSAGKITVPAKYSGIAVITIKAAETGTYKAAAKTITVNISANRTKVASLTNISGKKLKITWVRQASANGYQIQVSTSSKFTSIQKSKLAKNSPSLGEITFSGMTAGKTYYVRVRTVKTVGDKSLYSAWSGVKTIKITK